MKAWIGSNGYQKGLTFNDSEEEAEQTLRSDLHANIEDTNEAEDFSIQRANYLDDMDHKSPIELRAKIVAHRTLENAVNATKLNRSKLQKVSK